MKTQLDFMNTLVPERLKIILIDITKKLYVSNGRILDMRLRLVSMFYGLNCIISQGERGSKCHFIINDFS